MKIKLNDKIKRLLKSNIPDKVSWLDNIRSKYFLVFEKKYYLLYESPI